METKGKSERILEDLGCGTFQVILIALASVAFAAFAFTNHFIAFGNYNPGWRCLDQNNETLYGLNFTSNKYPKNNEIRFEFKDHITSKTNRTIWNVSLSGAYKKGDCPAFESCKKVEFNPEMSTLVTEWGLVCDHAWIPSFFISLQMIGFLIGASLGGVVSDAFGRKLVSYISVLSILLLNLISYFASSWQMFAALRFLQGIPLSFQANVYYVYIAEFAPEKWRAIVLGLPYYPIHVVLFGITCFLLNDWRHIYIAIIVISAIAMVPAVWLPKSLRWLELKNKTGEFRNTVQKIAKYNNKMLSDNIEPLNSEAYSETNRPGVIYALRKLLQLFRKEYRKNTLLLAVPWFSVSLLYYAIAFGVTALSGNFYFNLIAFYAIEIVVDFGIMFMPNVFGRKKAGIVLSGFSGICLLVAACFQELLSGDARSYGVASLVMSGRISISAFWVVLQIFTVEIYPTVIRSTAHGGGQTLARIGGILAPILIPTEESTVYICYVVMGGLAIICALIVRLLPETKGNALQETFQDNNTESLNENENNLVI